MTEPDFDAQFALEREWYLSNLDLVTWLRHYHVLRDLMSERAGDVLEIGAGDGIVQRSARPVVASYEVLDVNANLQPDHVGDVRKSDDRLGARFDTIIITEVLEHMPFEDMPASLANLAAWLRPGGRLIVSVPHRKSSIAVITPKQKLRTWRFPNGSISPSEFYHRFIRRRIWTDPNHVWEIGDGRVRRVDVETRFARAGFVQRKRLQLPYSDDWVLIKPELAIVAQQ